jgi:ribose transport system ATP-binding protein
LKPRVLLLDEPTRGVDVATKSQIYTLVREQAAAGCAVLLVSSELPEVLGLCDRSVVLHEGRITARFERGEATEESLLRACYGSPT